MFILSSPVFIDGAELPARFATRAVAGGQNVSPPFSWEGAPAGTRSYALTLVDHAPVAHLWVHWVVVDIPPTATSLAEGGSGSSAMPSGALELDSTFGARGYGGPQPPPGSGRHPYVATVYALDVPSLGLAEKTSSDQFERAITGHVLGRAMLTGYFGR